MDLPHGCQDAKKTVVVSRKEKSLGPLFVICYRSPSWADTHGQADTGRVLTRASPDGRVNFSTRVADRVQTLIVRFEVSLGTTPRAKQLNGVRSDLHRRYTSGHISVTNPTRSRLSQLTRASHRSLFY